MGNMVFFSGYLRSHFCLQAYFKLAEMHGKGEPVPLAAINCVILGCAKIWDADRAYQTFESIDGTFGLRPDVHSINALLEAFGKNKKVRP